MFPKDVNKIIRPFTIISFNISRVCLCVSIGGPNRHTGYRQPGLRILMSMGSQRRDRRARTLAECGLTIRYIFSFMNKTRPSSGSQTCFEKEKNTRRSVVAVGGALRSPTQYSAHCSVLTLVIPHIGVNQADARCLECKPLHIFKGDAQYAFLCAQTTPPATSIHHRMGRSVLM